MGAQAFQVIGSGANAEAAFRDAVSLAQAQYGYDTYSGTIAAKASHGIMKAEADPITYKQAQRQLRAWSDDDNAVYRPRKAPGYAQEISFFDKWGSTGYIEVTRASLPPAVLERFTFTEYSTKGGRLQTTVKGPKRGTRFFIFFGYAPD